ncbi:low specificity L-threonine aldolase [Paenibacillus antri]|uniref:Low specificity L-threonine aldolase n=1 Tax=Paenibacillus antri TaxID=2582848 RepID=A0A5R9GC54_9BACL|nr:beta-eliminating lyase-related protein [Paenibacillus antri]TLS50714.1 low specificity L-threonine aldolase [Paenibacillus antri]
MSESAAKLKETFKNAPYKLGAHSDRTVQVLMEAFRNVEEELESDMYGAGAAIEDFQGKMAAFLGKEAAVFFPSGTMAQQIALRIWCDRRELKRVAYHPLCHLEIHEEDGLKKLHGIEAVLLADRDRVVGADDVLGMREEVACVLLELPQREIGGQLPPYEELEAISAYCRERGIRLHLDGARLLESLPYYGKTAAEVCALFDSVYLSVYKGIGGVAGAVLAGDASFAAESKVWKRRHGGDLISLYPYVLSADYYFERRKDEMGRYYEEAKELAARFNACEGVSTRPETPVTNMFHVHLAMPKEEAEAWLTSVIQGAGVGVTSYAKEAGDGASYFEISIGDRYGTIPPSRLDGLFERMKKGLPHQSS